MTQSAVLLKLVEEMQNLLLSVATGREYEAHRYTELRTILVADSRTQKELPRWVHTCRNTDQVWAYIKAQFSSYAERRRYVWDAFRPLIEALEKSTDGPADKDVGKVLESFDVESVHRVWQRALERRADDPDGAITIARTLIETVCKHILDEEGVEYQGDEDILRLYKLVAKQLDLAPEDHAETALKRILGGATSVVEGIGALRNALSDAHGRGKGGEHAEPRHASLAVNLAGSVSTFLVETWDANEENDEE